MPDLAPKRAFWPNDVLVERVRAQLVLGGLHDHGRLRPGGRQGVTYPRVEPSPEIDTNFLPAHHVPRGAERSGRYVHSGGLQVVEVTLVIGLRRGRQADGDHYCPRYLDQPAHSSLVFSRTLFASDAVAIAIKTGPVTRLALVDGSHAGSASRRAVRVVRV